MSSSAILAEVEATAVSAVTGVTEVMAAIPVTAVVGATAKAVMATEVIAREVMDPAAEAGITEVATAVTGAGTELARSWRAGSAREGRPVSMIGL